MSKEIKLPCFGIVVTVDDNSGSIIANLHEVIEYDIESPDWDGPEDIVSKESYNNMIDGITSMILGHAIAGVDIESPAYIEGIEVAVDACGNNC